MALSADDFQLRKVALPVYLPTLLFTAGEAAMIPVIPVLAKKLGADLAGAGLVASMITLGVLLGDLPSGWFVAKVGERAAMLWSSLLALVGSILGVTAGSVLQLAIGVGLIGLSLTVFALARHAFLTTFVPLSYRARALSLLGGMFRGGLVAGPLLSAVILAWLGDPRWAFGLTIFFTLATVAVLLFMTDPESEFAGAAKVASGDDSHLTAGEDELESETHNVFASVWNNRKVLLRLGIGASLVGAIRTARSVVFPLWAVSIGLPESQTALILGLSGLLDFALFYTSGQVMDRWGRLASVLPSILIMGLSTVFLAFTHNWTSAAAMFIICVFVFAFGNGLGSGIILTLGSDLAPQTNPAPFLGAWRFMVDAGSGVAPLAIAGVTAVTSLALATGLLGVAGVVGTLVMLRYIPRFIPRVRNGAIADERLP